MTIIPPKELLPWLTCTNGEFVLKKGAPPELKRELDEFNTRYAKAKKEMLVDHIPVKDADN